MGKKIIASLNCDGITASENYADKISKYHTVGSYNGILAVVSIGSLYGAINQVGELVIPLIYDKIIVAGEVLCCRKNGMKSFYNDQGEELYKNKYDEIEPIYCGSSYHGPTRYVDNIFKVSKDNKYGLVNKNNIELPLIYSDIEFNIECRLFLAVCNGKSGVYGTDYKEILPCIYDRIEFSEATYGYNPSPPKNRYFIKVEQSSKYGISSIYGKEILPCKYNKIEIGDINNNKTLIIADNKYGLYDAVGTEFISCDYDHIQCIKDHLYVEKNEKSGLFDFDGKEILPCIYDKNKWIWSIDISKTDLFLFKKDGYSGVFYRDGAVMLPYEYEEIKKVDDFLLVTKNKKQALYDLNGNEILFCEYEKIKKEGDFILVTKKGKYGLYDLKGKEILSCLYESIWVFMAENKCMQIRKDGKYGLVDLKGKECIPCIYDELSYKSDNEIVVKKEEKDGVLNIHGEIISPFRLKNGFSKRGGVIGMIFPLMMIIYLSKSFISYILSDNQDAFLMKTFIVGYVLFVFLLLGVVNLFYKNTNWK